MSALTSIRCDPMSRACYDRRRAEGKLPEAAIIALARRRASVLWSLLRDNRPWEHNPPVTAANAA